MRRKVLSKVSALVAFAGGMAAPAFAGDVADAAMRGDAAAVRALLAERADVNAAQPDGATALHWAIYRNQPELVRALLDAGADVAAVNGNGVPPLQLAAESRRCGDLRAAARRRRSRRCGV